MSDPVLLDVINDVGIITLNREKVLNSVTDSMMKTVFTQIRNWQGKTAIILHGKKNYSSGGDIKSVWVEGFRPIHVYNAAFAAHTSLPPVVAFMEGYSMGAALAMAVFSKFSVATDDTIAAMPEVKVGMLPDVGGSYFLPRLKRNVGIYMGLTGQSLTGKDVWRSGLSTHYVPKHKIKQLKDELVNARNSKDIQNIIERYSETDDVPPLAANIEDVEYCFGGMSVEEVVRRLETLDNPWARDTLKTLRSVCPGSVKIAMRGLRRGAEMDVWSCLEMDYTFVYWSLRNHDFKEGVRAALVDKDHRPKWNPSTLSEVTEDYVNSFFKTSPEEYRLKLLTAAKL